MEQMNLTLAIKANNKGVTGTVRETAREVRGLQGSLAGNATAAQASTRHMAGLTTAGQEANRMFRLQKGSLQQAGYQFQDFAVQVGSGTSAFVALGQQGSQLLGLLGPGGALLGAVLAIGSVVGGSLVAAMGDGEDATKALDAALKSLDDTIEVNNGIPELTQQIRDLAHESEIAARARISSAMLAAEDAAKAAARGIGEAFGDLSVSDFFGMRDLGDFTESLGTFEAYLQAGYIQDELRELGELFGLSGQAAQTAGLEIGELLTRLRSNPSFENFTALEDAIGRFSAEGGEPNQVITRLIGNLGTYFDAARDAAERTEALEAALKDLSGSIRTDGADEIDKMINKLQGQAETLGFTTLEMISYNRQADLKAAADQGATEAQKAAIRSAYDAIYAHEQNAIATKKDAEAQRELERAQQSLKNGVSQLLDELDPLGARFESVYEKQQLLITAASEGWISEGQRDSAIKSLVEGLTEAGDTGGQQSAKEFENHFASAAHGVSRSLQDAIAAGDWDTLGEGIGNALATSASAIISDQITKSLSKNLTAESSTLAQISGAFAGPVAGAVVGGLAQLAMREIGDYFSDDWDPTASRQAAQGAGSVLGDINAKSESIRRAVEGSESGIGQLVGINQSMLAALRQLQSGISGASNRIARGAAGVSLSGPSVMSGSDLFANATGGTIPLFDESLELAYDFFDTMGEIFTLGTLDLDDLLGGKTKFVDEGVRVIGGTLDDLMSETIVQAYNTYRAKKHAFDDYDTYERFKDLGSEVGNQFSLVYESLFESVAAGADVLGMDVSGRLGNFQIDTQKISLEGLSADEQRAELEAYFGEVFDSLAEEAIPWLEEFQKAGEGLGETLASVANYTAVTQEAVDRLGVQFSDLAGEDLVRASERLMEAAGGVEQFIGSMEGFIDTFASDARQFELAQSDLTRALEQANLVVPATREGYYELLRAQNGATEAGAENIATLLQLRNAADEYYTYLEDAGTEAVQAQKSLLAEQRSMIEDTLREAERAANAVSNALNGLSVTGEVFERARRDQALSSLRGMVRAGSFSYDDNFTSALAAATNISVGDYGSMEDYIRDLAATGSVLSDLQAITDEQVAVEERMLSSLDRQIEATEIGSEMVVAGLSQINQTLGGGQITSTVTAASPVSVGSSRTAQSYPHLERAVERLSSELSTTQKAIAKHTAKTARLLERFELDGIEVRS